MKDNKKREEKGEDRGGGCDRGRGRKVSKLKHGRKSSKCYVNMIYERTRVERERERVELSGSFLLFKLIKW